MMRPAKIVWYACLLAALWAGAISAEETARVLTLDKAVSLALEKSPMLNSAKLGVNEASHRQEAARADFFPKLSTGYSYTKLDEPPEMRFSPLYHERLRPYVDQCQAFAHEGAPIMVPATQEALDARNATFREYAARFAG